MLVTTYYGIYRKRIHWLNKLSAYTVLILNMVGGNHTVMLVSTTLNESLQVKTWGIDLCLKSYYINHACSYFSLMLNVSYLLPPRPSNASNLFELAADKLFHWKNKKRNQSDINLQNFSKLPLPSCVSAIQPFPVTADEALSQAKANISTFMPNVISSPYSTM